MMMRKAEQSSHQMSAERQHLNAGLEEVGDIPSTS